MTLLLEQDVFCNCGFDILEYTVKEVRSSSEGVFFVLRSKKPVGQHRFIEVVVFENKEGDIRYLELNDTEKDDCEYGLEDFTNGKYFPTLEEAKSSFAKTQIELTEDSTRQLKTRIAENDRRIVKWKAMLL